ncbi:MAG: hypothetical protein NVSMB38_10410 [Ktedonobacteraceae bacterium]
MAVKSMLSWHSSDTKKKRIYTWLGVICVGIVLSLIAGMTFQFAHPPLPPRLVLEQDIPLPGAMPDVYRTSQYPLAPGQTLLFDHFDFQAIDPQTHWLFIAHTGPNPDREAQVNHHFNPVSDAKNDGNVIIFNTQQKKVIGLLNIPQVTGLVIAEDLHKVFAADSNDNIVYSVDERTLIPIPIRLQKNDSPDSIAYDSIDHLVFVSVPGTPANLNQSQAIDQKNQNETVIDALTNKVITRIPMGVDGKWGDDVGHVRFDPALHRIFVVVQQLADPDSPNPNQLPPPGTARLVEINPVTRQVSTRLTLSYPCINAHGLVIDTQQHIGFVACVNSDPTSILRVDLETMKVFSEPAWPVEIKPDILALDSPLHLVYVACGSGISLFRENGRNFYWLANYTFGISTHTIAVNEETHEIYLPLSRVGGRPVLRIMRYNPDGAG